LRTNAATSTWRKYVVANTQYRQIIIIIIIIIFIVSFYPLHVSYKLYVDDDHRRRRSVNFLKLTRANNIGRGPNNTQVFFKVLVILIMNIRTMSSSAMISYVGSYVPAVIPMRQSLKKKLWKYNIINNNNLNVYMDCHEVRWIRIIIRYNTSRRVVQ
jgi:hypothetical protein